MTTHTPCAFSNYIFGYGSLICPSSRAITAPSLVGRSAVPVRVNGLERIWSLPDYARGAIYMGIRVQSKAECVGVLVPVNEEELTQFDIRELGYDRLPIDHKDVRPIEDNDDDNNNSMPLNFQATLWVYVQQAPEPVSKECPIAQTYLDVILRGCLSISEDFARDFLQTTRGWHFHDFHHVEDDATTKNKENQALLEHTVHWVDDRANPLYVRADIGYSKAHANTLDSILREHRPEWAHRRIM